MPHSDVLGVYWRSILTRMKQLYSMPKKSRRSCGRVHEPLQTHSLEISRSSHVTLQPKCRALSKVWLTWTEQHFCEIYSTLVQPDSQGTWLSFLAWSDLFIGSISAPSSHKPSGTRKIVCFFIFSAHPIRIQVLRMLLMAFSLLSCHHLCYKALALLYTTCPLAIVWGLRLYAVL